MNPMRDRKPYQQKNMRKYVKNNQTLRRKRHKMVDAIKDVPCADCGMKYPSIVMEFDHRDRTTKVESISRMLSRAFAWEKVLEEVAKCDIVCSNCHRLRTGVIWEMQRNSAKI